MKVQPARQPVIRRGCRPNHLEPPSFLFFVLFFQAEEMCGPVERFATVLLMSVLPLAIARPLVWNSHLYQGAQDVPEREFRHRIAAIAKTNGTLPGFQRDDLAAQTSVTRDRESMSRRQKQRCERGPGKVPFLLV